jgi:hypothetical protein
MEKSKEVKVLDAEKLKSISKSTDNQELKASISEKLKSAGKPVSK